MSTPKLHILALEPDQTRGRRLRNMLAERTGATIVAVCTVDEVIERMATCLPDALLMSSLLPPQDEARLQQHLRERDERATVPVLVVPPVNESSEAASRRSLFALGRREKAPARQFDADALATRIQEAIADARRHQADRAARAAEYVDAGREQPIISVVKLDPGANVRRFRAHRCTPNELGWLSGAKTSYGLPVRIVNISDSGLLVEAPDKIMSGSSTEIQLYAPDRTIVIPSRVVRAEVAGVNARGVKYHMAAAFDTHINLMRSAIDHQESPASPRALADLLARVSGEIEVGRGAAAVRAYFEQGLQKLIPSSEIHLCETPVETSPDRDSICFRVPTPDGPAAVLQVTFDRGYEPAAREFTLLKASATAAAIVLIYEQRPGTPAEVNYLPTAAARSSVVAG